MCASFRVGDGDIADSIDRERVIEAAVVAKNTAVTVGSVFAETHVGNDEQCGKLGAEEADRLNDRSIRIISGSAQGVFDVRSCGYAEKNDGAEPLADKRLEVRNESIDAASMLVGKGGDEGFLVWGVGDEERINQHRLGTEISKKGSRVAKRGLPWSIVFLTATTLTEDDRSLHATG